MVRSSTGSNPTHGASHCGTGVEGNLEATTQVRSNEGVQVSGGNRISAFIRLTPASARMPPSPSWGSVDSSGRKVHARNGSDSSVNLSNRNTSSGEYTIRSASLASSSDEREPISLSQDEEPDTQAEEGGATSSRSFHQ